MSSYEPENILITGAGGFIAAALAPALLEANPNARLNLVDIFEPPVPPSAQQYADRISTLQCDLNDPARRVAVFGPRYTCVYLLHGIMSAGTEADMDLGLRVNVDSMRQMLDILRYNQPGIKVIFSSSLAIYGPTRPSGVIERDEIFTETTLPMPRSSYGAQKFMTEVLLNDYARRGFLDARIVRLPTVVVRPGKPSNAASSFASGIIR